MQQGKTDLDNTETLDRRLNAWRPDLADLRLKGKVEAKRFAAGQPARIIQPSADVVRHPAADAPLDTQLLRGDIVDVFERHEGWAWVQNRRDRYVGYVADEALGSVEPAPTNRICVPRTFLYPGPDMKLPRSGVLSLGSLVTMGREQEVRGTRYVVLTTGDAIIANHAKPVGKEQGDFVAIAETLRRTPYLWGGATAFGIDCSGLVQLAMFMTGRIVPRDSDMQAQTLGQILDDDALLQRGDLVFWKGHVAIMRDDKTLIHANGATMDVAVEPLADAIARIEPFYGRPTVRRRP
jgi:cell wall-associated NlpC family hydrolase